MSRSYKKVAGGTNCVCKSQKKGKITCNRLFRRLSKYSLKLFKIDKLPVKTIEIMNPWDLGGDGKQIYKSDDKELIKKWKRK